MGLRTPVSSSATRRLIVSWLVGRAARVVVAAAVLGAAVVALSSRVLTALMFGVSPVDPFSYVVAVLIVLVGATAGAWLPARRAMLLDPTTALRRESNLRLGLETRRDYSVGRPEGETISRGRRGSEPNVECPSVREVEACLRRSERRISGVTTQWIPRIGGGFQPSNHTLEGAQDRTPDRCSAAARAGRRGRAARDEGALSVVTRPCATSAP